MRIADVLSKDNIITELKGREKRAVLEELALVISDKVPGVSKDQLVELVLEREKLGSTGIGHGVAIPHTKVKGADQVIVCFGRSPKGIDFDSLDGKAVHLFFLIVAPENSTVVHLKVLSAISRILKSDGFRKKLINAPDDESIYSLILEEEKLSHKGAS